MSAFSAAISPDFTTIMSNCKKEEYASLLQAVHAGDGMELAVLLNKFRIDGHGTGPYLSENYTGGCTPLHLAATRQDTDCMRKILNAAREVYPEVQEFFTEENSDCPHPSLGPYFEKDDSGATPLHYAACYNTSPGITGDSVAVLLSEKVGAHACVVCDYMGVTPLALAVKHCNAGSVQKLVMAKTKDGTQIGKSALHITNDKGELPHDQDGAADVPANALIRTYLIEMSKMEGEPSGAFTKRAA